VETILLETKLHIPPVRLDLVSRPQLIEKLNAGLSGRLTLVSAPAGFGKTTVIAGWLGQLPVERRVAWISLEENDSDPPRFLAYLIGALQTIFPSTGRDLLATSPFPPLDTAIHFLIHEVAVIAHPCLLVLDDYHLITTPTIHQAMATFIEHMPPGMHLVIISRADPPFSLSRWRVRRQMTEIRARDLRFSPAEATKFLNQTMALALSPTEVALLEKRTEGWIAGLQLAAHSLLSEDDHTDFLTAFAGDDRYVADYLVEEVLTHQPPSIQSFLLKTSILTRLSGSLCNALLDRQDSQSILESFEQSNLFIIPLDNRRQWYRYHHLFVDLLRERLAVTLEERRELHRRASRWHADHSFLPAAVEHSLSAADYEKAMALILNCATEMFMTSRLSTLIGWWRKIPEKQAHQNLQLCMMIAWAWLALGDHQESEHCLQIIEESMATPMSSLLTDINTLPPEVRNALIEVAAVRMSHQSIAVTDAREVLELSRKILPYLTAENPIHLFNPLFALRPVVQFNIGLANQFLGRLDEAVVAFQEAVTAGRALGNVHIVAPALGHLAEVEILQGQLRQALKTCQQGIEVVEAMARKTSPLLGLLHIRLGQLFYEWNELKTAVHHLQEGIRVAEPWHNRETLLPGYLALARAYRALNREEEAIAAEGSFSELLRDDPTANDAVAKAQHVWLQAQHGAVESARRWAASADSCFYAESAQEREVIILARVWLVLGEVDRARRCIDELLNSAEKGRRWGRVIELLVMRALALVEQNRHDDAQRSLSRALRLAIDEGYLRTFVDGGEPVVQLLREVEREERGGQGYASRVLVAISVDKEAGRKTEGTTQSVPQQQPHPPMVVEPLSNRELEVLQLIAEGLTNKEIAARLYLAAGTVKVHAHNIYNKLGVNGRTQAVAKARVLNILP